MKSDARRNTKGSDGRVRVSEARWVNGPNQPAIRRGPDENQMGHWKRTRGEHDAPGRGAEQEMLSRPQGGGGQAKATQMEAGGLTSDPRTKRGSPTPTGTGAELPARERTDRVRPIGPKRETQP